MLMFTEPGDTILDPFAGFGSIPAVAEVMGRRWLAFEIDPFKFEVAYKFIVERQGVDVQKMKEEREDDRNKTLDGFFSG